MIARKTIVSSAVLAAITAMTQNAIAQGTLEEVVVTAQKRAQSITDVGITINAFSNETLKDLGIDNVVDIAAHTPGLIYNEAGGLGVPVYTIRGVGFDDYSVASNSTVGVYVDEVALPYPVMTRGMMYDIERVEVLKGPQGDLYGRNATGGAINFINQKPTEDFESAITLGYETYETVTAEGYISGALTDTVRARLSGTYKKSNEGWMDSHTRDDELGEFDNAAMRLLLDWDASETLSVRFNVHYTGNDSENAGQARSGQLGTTFDPFLAEQLSQQSGWLALPLAAAGLGNAGIPIADSLAPASPEDPDKGDWNEGFDPENNNDLFGGSVTLNWELDGMLLTSISAYDKFERDDAFDWDGTSLSLFEQVSDTEITSYSQELRLTSDNDSDLSWIAGLYYSHDKIDDTNFAFVGDASGSNGLFGTVENTFEQKTETAAAYAHLEWNFAESWGATFGARFTHEDRDVDACSRDVDGGLAFLFADLDLIDFDLGGTGDDFFLSSTPLSTGDCVTVDPSKGSFIPDANGPGTAVIYGGESDLFSDDISVDNFSGKVGLDYSLTEDVLVYGSIGTGFKSGGYNGALASSFLQLDPYDEEELLAYEVGIKATLLDGSMQLNAATFYYDYDDKQVISVINDPVFGPLAALVNVPDSEIFGAEFEASWLPTDRLTLNLGPAYLDTEVTKYEGFNPLDPGLGKVDFEGAELGSAPELTANLRASYQWNVSDNLFVRLATDASYTDDYHSGLQYVNPKDERFDVDSYTLVNARATLGALNDNWEVAAWVKNIGDEYYYHSSTFSNDAITRGVGRGRTYGGTLTYRWN
jgi:iron complex outermembrane receptor protein